jgi:hypothetical protein
MEREAPSVVRRAQRCGVHVDYRGIAPLFKDSIAYAGGRSDWVVGPMQPSDRVMPRWALDSLKALHDADMRFPVLYVAHETGQGQSDHPPIRRVEAREALELIGPVPPPADSVALADRLDTRAQQVFTAIRRMSTAAGAATLAALAAPVILAGSAAAALATVDPIVFGVIPAVSPREGEPSAWYELARWDW